MRARTSAFASIVFVSVSHACFSVSSARQSVKWHVGAPAGIVASNRTAKPKAPANSVAASIIPCTKYRCTRQSNAP